MSLLTISSLIRSFFCMSTEEKGALVNPFDVLALHGTEGHEAGQTHSLRDFATGQSFDLDERRTGGESCEL